MLEKLTSMNKAGFGQPSKREGKEISGESSFLLSIHRLLSRIQRHVAGRHEAPGETSGLLLLQRVAGRRLERGERGWAQVVEVNDGHLLLKTSSKLCTDPLFLKLSYSRGSCMSHLTLCENNLFITIHFASLSHSSTLRP